MSILENRSEKRFMALLVIALISGIITAQIFAYVNAVHFKKQMIAHDYEVAGYLSSKHPELNAEIWEAFTAEKFPDDLETGKSLLERPGYKYSMLLDLVARARGFYTANRAASLILSMLFSLAVLSVTWSFLQNRYRKINQYYKAVNRIMEGEITTRLEDNEEGNLAKLAASINMMTTSLYTHVEKEKQSRIFLKDVLTNVSHQLKTPLSALAMYVDIMKEEDPDNDVIAKFLGKSGNELDRMQVLIANLLKLAKLDAGIIELNKSSNSLKDIVEKVAESFETRLIKEQKIFELKSDGSIGYFCDREWMYEAISNLFKNAVEHTGTGAYIKVSIEETPLVVRISVEDNGEGIHPEDINYIFKRFYRSRFSQDKQGTGIGLNLAKAVVEMHDGFISVESIMKERTKFTIHLPGLQNCKI
ncbi:MAG TPA: HAMP domain-containing sensor histidine kinase [Clostridia bacterium]|nr:HAMP domain-containing sensor histidine kinase [Clostridia bacterium]